MQFLNFKIGGIKKSSLLDFPNKISAIVFTQGCNFNCSFCHNPSLLKINQSTNLTVDNFFDFLQTRKGKLDGVVITGGEPTMQPDLVPFIQKIKNLDFLVKLDTNGTNPDIIEYLLYKNLIDYIAMDIKAPLDKYHIIANANVNKELIKKSINLIMNSSIDYEFRTTFMPYLHNIEDFECIGKLIEGAKCYYLQKFDVQSEINNPKLKNEKNFSEQDILKIMHILKKYITNIQIR